MTALCDVCGTRIDPVAAPTHPLCEPETVAAMLVLDRRRREAQRAAEAGKRRALRSVPGDAQLGLDLIRRAALHREYLSADELRDTFEAVGINMTKRAGGIWSAAIKAGVVQPVTESPSAGVSAHGKKINRYRSLVWRGAA